MILKFKYFICIIFSISMVLSEKNEILEYKKLIDKTLRYVENDYVDTTNQSDLIISSLKGMLDDLDPYTKIVIGSSKDRLDMLTKGKYGGVGIRIGSLRDTLTVLSPMEDSPAYSEGIISGDQIIKIDTIQAIGFSTRQASEIIRGELGSIVELKVRRPGLKKYLTFELKRSNIAVKDVPFWKIDENSIGYIRITRFSRNTFEDFSKALSEIDAENFYDNNGNGFRDLEEKYIDENKNGEWDFGERYADKNKNGEWDSGEKYDDSNKNGIYDKNGQLKGLIIDLRGNSGGLLSEAIQILNTLIRKGQPLLYTKGRDGKILRKYKSTSDPVLSEDIPIAVLVNNSSASASEIISGVIQDLDRGIVIGRTTFGKGLVQQVRTLNDTISLKVTNAKYYIPSGRLIQKEDYSRNKKSNLNNATFSTLNMNRPVNGGGGITPDVKTKPNIQPSFIRALWREGLFLRFSSQYINVNNITNVDFKINKKILNEFEKYCENLDSELDYELPGERDLAKMKDNLGINESGFNIARNNNFLLSWYVKGMNKYFEKQKKKQFKDSENIVWIKNGLEREFSRIIVNERARIGAALNVDSEYKEAVNILSDYDKYYSILGF